jgi:hypothetical protein
MNFDEESILIEDLGAATPSLPMCERAVDLAHNTSIMGDISHSSIAGTEMVEDVLDADAPIVTPTDLEEVSTVIDLICYCLTSFASNHSLTL